MPAREERRGSPSSDPGVEEPLTHLYRPARAGPPELVRAPALTASPPVAAGRQRRQPQRRRHRQDAAGRGPGRLAGGPGRASGHPVARLCPARSDGRAGGGLRRLTRAPRCPRRRRRAVDAGPGCTRRVGGRRRRSLRLGPARREPPSAPPCIYSTTASSTSSSRATSTSWSRRPARWPAITCCPRAGCASPSTPCRAGRCWSWLVPTTGWPPTKRGATACRGPAVRAECWAHRSRCTAARRRRGPAWSCWRASASRPSSSPVCRRRDGRSWPPRRSAITTGSRPATSRRWRRRLPPTTPGAFSPPTRTPSGWSRLARCPAPSRVCHSPSTSPSGARSPTRSPPPWPRVARRSPPIGDRERVA